VIHALLTERERERQRRELEGFKSKMASGDDTARAVTTTLTTSSEPEVDRSVHPSGIVPTLQCVLFHIISLMIIVHDEKKKRELSLGKTPRDRRV
jgi:hypothetical protein